MTGDWTDDLLGDLNPAQIQAVTHTGRPLLVVAGPGSGKTRVITRRVAFRIQSGAVAPERILGLTFTQQAAREMKQRVGSCLRQQLPIRLGTFHWACNALLRRHADRIGYRRDFRLLSPAEARSVLQSSLTASPSGAAGSSVLSIAISKLKNGESKERAAHGAAVEVRALQAVHLAYARRLRSMHALDLDDLLVLTVDLLSADRTVLELCRANYDEVLIDEYQDVNPLQHEIVRLLRPTSGDVVAVGDEDQAIFGWRQAGGASMHDFLRDFDDARTIALDINYRSSKRILRSAGALIAHNPGRLGKPLQSQNAAGRPTRVCTVESEHDEAGWIARELSRVANKERRDWSDFAVLYRVNAQSRLLEDALMRAAIPYQVISGRRFFELPEVRIVAHLLRLALDQSDDDALKRLLFGLRGIGPARLEALVQAANAAGSTLLEYLRVSGRVGPIPRTVAGQITDLVQTIDRVVSLRHLALGRVVDAAIESAERFDHSSTDPLVRQDNLAELRSVVHEYEGRRGTLRVFLDYLTMGAGDETSTGGVSLLTMHAAKGLEFAVVFVTGLEEGLIPHHRSLNSETGVAEERRLLYVAMTRARERLYLLWARARMQSGLSDVGRASRFVREIGSHDAEFISSELASQKPRLTNVRVGDRIKHPRWEAGTVDRIEGSGKDILVTIRFDIGIARRLQLFHAPLTRFAEDADRAHVG